MERKGQNSAEINNVEMNTHTEHKTISESGWCCCGQCRRFKDKEKHNLSPVSQGGTRTYWNETKYRKDIKLIPQRYRKSYEMITNTCMPTIWTV